MNSNNDGDREWYGQNGNEEGMKNNKKQKNMKQIEQLLNEMIECDDSEIQLYKNVQMKIKNNEDMMNELSEIYGIEVDDGQGTEIEIENRRINRLDQITMKLINAVRDD